MELMNGMIVDMHYVFRQFQIIGLGDGTLQKKEKTEILKNLDILVNTKMVLEIK